jgi:hypothetical protein
MKREESGEWREKGTQHRDELFTLTQHDISTGTALSLSF